MIKRCFYLFLLIVLMPGCLFSQQKKETRASFNIGLNISYFPEAEFTNSPYHEGFVPVKISLSYEYNRLLRSGASYNHIFHSSTYPGREKQLFRMVDFFTELNAVNVDRHRFYLKASLSYGDMCLCDEITTAYTRPGLIYGGLGAGYNLRVYRNWSFNVMADIFHIFNKIEYKFTFPFVYAGFNYKLYTQNHF